MTGVEFDNLVSQSIDQAYSDYLGGTANKNRVYKMALINAIEKNYLKLDEQTEYDKLKTLIKTNRVFSVNNNQIYTTSIAVSGVTYAGLNVTVTTVTPHNVLAGQTITLAGVGGITSTPAINTAFVVATFPIPTATTFTFTVTAISGTYTAQTGTLTYPNLISDYQHLFAVKSKFSKSFTDVTITGVTNATPIVVTLSGTNNLRTGELVTISGVIGTSSANTTCYVKQLNSVKFALYLDAKLTTALTGNANYDSGGVLSRTSYSYCTPYFSDRKISVYGIPTVDEPKFEMANNMIKLYPLTETCTEITIDYLTTATQFIISDNSVIDLEIYYPIQLLYEVKDEAANLFAAMSRDQELFKTSDYQLKTDK